MTKMGAFSVWVSVCVCVIGNRIECTFINWKWMEKATFVLRLLRLLLLLPLVIPNGFWGLHCWKLQTLFVVTVISQSVLYNCKSNKNDQSLSSFLPFSLPRAFTNNFCMWVCVCMSWVSFGCHLIWIKYPNDLHISNMCVSAQNAVALEIGLPTKYRRAIERSSEKEKKTSVRWNGQG